MLYLSIARSLGNKIVLECIAFIQCLGGRHILNVFSMVTHTLEISLQVLFVCTANVVEMIPNPLLDRMEVISIAGYITDEKMHIARDYLEKSTREACGIKPEQVSIFSTCF